MANPYAPGPSNRQTNNIYLIKIRHLLAMNIQSDMDRSTNKRSKASWINPS